MWVAATVSGVGSVLLFSRDAPPLHVVFVLAASIAIAAFLLGVATRDYSWVDRSWSTVPPVFAWVYAVRSGFDPAVTVVAVLITMWGLRLTFNFARRGGYTSIEDYRWPILRERIGNPVLWHLFHLLFICAFQVFLFVAFTLPVHALAVNPTDGITTRFALFAVLFLLALIWETIADEQQWRFQNVKSATRGRPSAAVPITGINQADIRRGFRTTGLFRYSRHPNYFGELMVWWCVYFMMVGALGIVAHPSGVGAVLLTLLFIGSTRFTESITLSRYPEYRTYQITTSAIVPWPPRAVDEEAEMTGSGAATT
ncbi:MAG: DUF1295 domain-containing protein [Spirochaetaceae bacterium]|nr:MAG: DUF1295 domain-containing protein [Spirochaetaceae bacterium]